MAYKKLYIFIGIIVGVAVIASLINVFAPRDIDPWSYGAFARGVRYLKKGDYQSAIIAFTTVVKNNPDSAQGYFNLGCAYDAAGVVHLAIKSYKKAVEIKPSYSKAYFNLANIYDVVGRKQDAVESYRKLLELDPHHREGLFALIKDYVELKRIDDARAHLDTARIWFGGGRYQKTLDELEQRIDEEESSQRREQPL